MKEIADKKKWKKKTLLGIREKKDKKQSRKNWLEKLAHRGERSEYTFPYKYVPLSNP